MQTARNLRRFGRIVWVLRRHRLLEGWPELLRGRGWLGVRWLGAFHARPSRALPRGARLRLALQELGPIFVKFGQVLSTRRDLLDPDVADELALLQDQVAPFPAEMAVAEVERALGGRIDDLFAHFDAQPLASASVAQAHAARLPDGSDVVVKVLRPGVQELIETDLALLNTLARWVERLAAASHRLQPLEVVREIERTLRNELDLQREGANACVFRRFWESGEDLRVPRVHWSHSKAHVLTLERVYGVRSDDVATLRQAGIDLPRLAAKGVRLFYQQVFRDNFFHADAHAGNIWVDTRHPEKLRFVAVDFGMMGTLSAEDQWYLAANFEAVFQRDYRRVAQLHLDAGWVPGHIRADDLEAAVRSVCEPYFTRPLSEISLGEVIAKLFQVAHRYELTLQPQLLLLQKTLLNIEGLGRQLDPRLDIWAVAQPVLADILRQKYTFENTWKEMQRQAPEWLRQLPQIPRLVHVALQQHVQGKQQLNMRSEELRQLVAASHRGQRRAVQAVLGLGLLVAGALLCILWALGVPAFQGWGVRLAVWAACVASGASFVLALRR